MKKIKISELPLYQSLKGLFVMGTDVNNRSVKVNLEFIESETTKAVKDAQQRLLLQRLRGLQMKRQKPPTLPL